MGSMACSYRPVFEKLDEHLFAHGEFVSVVNDPFFPFNGFDIEQERKSVDLKFQRQRQRDV